MSQAQTTAANVTALKASAHLMVLEPGVFCVYNGPDSPAADPETGLPCVRLSAAPAAGAYRGQVALTGFGENGLIESTNDAALVRVIGGPAQVLVTIYQASEGSQEAPKLQVLRLSEAAKPATAPQPQPQPAPAAQPAQPGAGPLEVAAHIYGRGDVAGRLGEWMGERGSKRWIEGFGLQPARAVPAGDIEYQAVLGRGWLSPWVEGGQFCGSRGMSLPILGLRVRLKGASAQRFSIVLAATFVDGTQVGPVGAGEACEAPSLAALESFIVMLQPKQAEAPPRPQPTIPAEPTPQRAPAKRTQPKPAAAKPEPAPRPAPSPAKPARKPARKR